MDNIFEINNLSNINIDQFRGGHTFIMDNFYKHPEKVIDWINAHEPFLWKKEQQPSYNGVKFFDLRHRIECPQLLDIQNQLSKIVHQKPLNPGTFTTNKSRFEKDQFNDYQNNFWWPHLDDGYTALIYLNHQTYPGTNIYDDPEEDSYEGVTEHLAPWRSKKKWELVKNFEAKFNRLIIFNANELFHGMAVDNELFFGNEYRLNQVIFFDSEQPI